MTLHTNIFAPEISYEQKRRATLVPGRCRALKLTQVFAGNAWRDLAQLKLVIMASGEEAADNAAIDAAGVLIADGGLEKFPGGEVGVRSLPQKV